MQKTHTKILALAAAAALATGVAACGDDSVGVGGQAHVTVLLTDAPVDYVDSAMVDIGLVELVPADGGAHVVLSTDGTVGPVNLLELQDAATQILADATIDPGTYSQLRLIVESASVSLVAGAQFDDGTTEKALKVPSGAQTGIKLNLTGGDGEPLEIPAGDLALVVDFDVSKSFVIQGNPVTPAGIKGMIFKPTLRVVVMDVAGTISGTVTTSVDSARVDSLMVSAEPLDSGSVEAYQTQAATTMTDADGNYTLFFVIPGSYSVKVTPADSLLVTQPDSAVVTVGVSEDVIGVDFEVVEAP